MSYQDLAYAVVEQAVEDYKECRRNHRSVYEVVTFFKSEWCNLLLKNTPFNGEEILAVLESRVY